METLNRKTRCTVVFQLAASISLTLAGCVGTETSQLPVDTTVTLAPDVGTYSAPTRDLRTYQTDALIYNGDGTAESDAQSLINLVASKGLTYKVVNSSTLNGMTTTEISNYGVILWPGGLSNTMSYSLTDATRKRIRQSIVENGVSYVGFCAGAFIAGTYDWPVRWGLELTSQDFPIYYLEYQGIDRTMVDITFPDGNTRNIVWYGGPELEQFGNVIGRYPEGGNAIAQDWIGKGFVILSAVHPEAPDSWRAGLNDVDGNDLELTWTLIQSALKQIPMPTF